jgi:hypothetical protein
MVFGCFYCKAEVPLFPNVEQRICRVDLLLLLLNRAIMTSECVLLNNFLLSLVV